MAQQIISLSFQTMLQSDGKVCCPECGNRCLPHGFLASKQVSRHANTSVVHLWPTSGLSRGPCFVLSAATIRNKVRNTSHAALSVQFRRSIQAQAASCCYDISIGTTRCPTNSRVREADRLDHVQEEVYRLFHFVDRVAAILALSIG